MNNVCVELCSYNPYKMEMGRRGGGGGGASAPAPHSTENAVNTIKIYTSENIVAFSIRDGQGIHHTDVCKLARGLARCSSVKF